MTYMQEAKNLHRNLLMLLLWDYFGISPNSEACKISWRGGEISSFFIPWSSLIIREFFGFNSLMIHWYVTEVL